jgi:chromosome segregation ATPase
MEPSSGHHALEDEKARLELEKLRLEVAQLQASWWKKPPYLAVLVPIAIATFTFFGIWMTGLFDQKREQLLSEKRVLEAEVKELAVEKSRSQKEKVSLAAQLASLQKAVIATTKESDRLSLEKRDLEGAIAATNKTVARVQAEIKELRREKSDLERRMATTNEDIAQAQAALHRQREKAKEIVLKSLQAVHKLDSLFSSGALEDLMHERRYPEKEDPAFHRVATITAEVRTLIDDLRKVAGEMGY